MPYQMKNGKWRGKRMIEGKLKTRVFETKTEAKKWEVEQSAAKWEAESLTTPTVCWLDFLNAYLKMAEERFSKKTWKEKRRSARLSLKVIPPETGIDDIEARHALEVVRQAALVSGNAANNIRKNLAAAWSWGQKYYGLSQVNPFLAVERFPADQNPRYVPPEEDFWKVYDIADDTDKVFLLFLLHTGARCGEVFRLTWDDVDFSGQRVRLGTRKTRDGGMKYAWLPLTHALHTALLALRKERPFARLVFEQKTGRGQYTSRQHMMPQLCAEANVKPLGFHGIRHLAATILAYSGLDLPTVQAMLHWGGD